MEPAERLRAALGGQPLDRPPLAFWRHFPGRDEDPRELAQAHLEFFREVEPDFLKITSPSGYNIQDWGAEFEPGAHPEGVRSRVRLPVRSPADWRRLEPLDPKRGVLGRQLQGLRRLRRQLPGTPLLFTVFSPLSTFRSAVGDAWIEHLRQHRREADRGLEVITTSTRRLVEAVFAAGADGIFFAEQTARAGELSLAELRRWGRGPSLEVLEAAAAGWCNVLHLHGEAGEEILFPAYLDLPVQAINWHDRVNPPSLHQARQLTSLCLVGGLDQRRTLRAGTPTQARAEALDALRQTEGRAHVLAPGCVLLLDTPLANLRAVRRATELRAV